MMTNKKVSVWWKYGLLTVCGLLLVLFLVGVYLFDRLPDTTTANDTSHTENTVVDTQEKVSTTTAISPNAFNEIVEAAIGGADVPYQVTVTDVFTFEGTFEVYGKSVPYTIIGEPTADADGNVVIAVMQIDLIGITLPTTTALQLFQVGVPTDLPLTIKPDAEQIVIRFDQLSERLGFTVKAARINLENDQIEMQMDLPVSLLISAINQQQK